MKLTPYLLTLFTVLFQLQISVAQYPPYPKSKVIRDVKFDWSSHIRLASGSDNWPITWADDGHQYTVWGDGGGFGGTNGIGRSSLGIARIEGSWHDFRATNVWGGHNTENEHKQIGKSYGIVCIDAVLYMWVGMFQTKEDQFDETRIAYSKDHGASWTFADWAFTRQQNIMMPTVCNYGKNYQGARDEYVYSYLIRFQSYQGPDDYPDKVDWLNVQKPGNIDLARVHKDSILFQNAYDFFSGMKDSQPVWTKDVAKRKPVFENADGVGWCINVSYNSGLKRYILTTEHTESHRGHIGIFDAPEPWGPWSTVHYEYGWGEGHFPLNTFYWNFSNKWLSEDGQTFSMIFTGRKENDSFNVIRGKFVVE
ncbi:MAG: hypothetical protein KI791_01185 [Cyclobacteriaceae bacterium]|nr:hypothetical protein [Cyclobacteriaceae bacterium SS2]